MRGEVRSRRGPVVASVAVGFFAMLMALAGLDARATSGARVSGDEPQYLLSATSIAEDLSLDISDEIDGRRFEPYHEVELDTQTKPLGGSGRRVSPHDPLLPAILAVPMWAGGWMAAKAMLAVIAGLTAAATTWVAMRRLGLGPVPAAVGTGAAFGGIPLAAYGGQVYPEMPAALATIVAVAALTTPAMGWRHHLVALVAVVALPWLAVKYVPVAAVLGVALLWRVRHDRRQALAGGGVAAVAGALYLAAHRVWYGGWTVYATGDHFARSGEFSVVGTDVDVLGRSRRLAGLIVDQDFGIAAWSPVWLLAPLGLGLMAGRRSHGRWLAFAVVAAGWLSATFVALTMHGWWVPGRQIVVVLPIVALGIATLAARARSWCVGTGVLGLLGTVSWIWLAIESSTGGRTLIVDFAETVAPPYRLMRAIFPDGLTGDATSDVLLGAWAVVLLVTMLAGWRRASHTHFTSCRDRAARRPGQ